MAKSRRSNGSQSKRPVVSGAHAVLGMDIVAFSMLHDEDQITAIDHLIRWINEALAFHSISEDEYRWSPAGDGGYLTFATSLACRKAVDVAFAVCQKCAYPTWRPRDSEKIRLRLALHAGSVQEARELGRNTNVWGMGINMTARILTVAAPSQLLMSKQYYDGYIKAQREDEFQMGDVHWRTVKHGVHVEVMNINRDSLCLTENEARDRRWQAVGGLWRRTVQEYTYLIHDAMKSGEPIAAMAAASFLLDLNEPAPVRDLCSMVGHTDERPTQDYPARSHPLFSEMPPDVLFEVIRCLTPRVVKAGESVCERGDPADSCFFPVSGTIVVDVPGQEQPIPIRTGQIIGEFSLWVPSLDRTAAVRAIDDALLLEIREDDFEASLRKAPHVADVVYGIIKRRMLDNVLKSKRLFPVGIGQALVLSAHDQGVACDKYGANTRLDLKNHAFLVFNGSVRIEPHNSDPIDIRAPGVWGREQVVGIVSDLGNPDGETATTLDEVVAVKLHHDVIRDLQQNEQTLAAWNALCGERLGEIHRATAGEHESNRQSLPARVATVHSSTSTTKRDIFISYSSADKRWGEWIAWELEAANYSVVIQAWDFRPGANFVVEMQRAATECEKTVAVVSETYLKSMFTDSEWSAAFVQDPRGLDRRLIPVRVDRCHPEGLLKAIVYIDLVGLGVEQARHALLDGLSERAKPTHPPSFPGQLGAAGVAHKATPTIAHPTEFPGVSSRATSLWREKLAFFLEQEPLISDTTQKFALRKQVEEIRAKIRELGGE